MRSLCSQISIYLLKLLSLIYLLESPMLHYGPFTHDDDLICKLRKSDGMCGQEDSLVS